jgi:hypothetical protein
MIGESVLRLLASTTDSRGHGGACADRCLGVGAKRRTIRLELVRNLSIVNETCMRWYDWRAFPTQLCDYSDR